MNIELVNWTCNCKGQDGSKIYEYMNIDAINGEKYSKGKQVFFSLSIWSVKC